MRIQANTSDIVEPYVMPTDSEIELRIVDVREGEDKNGNPYIMPRFEVVGEIAAKEIGYFLGLPGDNQTEKQRNATLNKLNKFCEAIGVSLEEGFEPEDLVGKECVAIVGVEDNAQYGEQNYIKTFVRM